MRQRTVTRSARTSSVRSRPRSPSRDDARMQPTIALLGPPGSGKGTQAKRMRDELGFAWLSTGDLLREARAEGSELGTRAGEYMDRGELVPDEVIVDLIERALAELGDRPILLDGFPRTVAQAEALVCDLDAAILIDVPDDLVVERIAGRGQGRADDNPETVRERLRVYHRETEPLVDHYERQGKLRRVDGAQDQASVHAEVRAALG
jgi:adenylate kinase